MVDLPQPDLPTRPTLSPAIDGQTDIVDGVELGPARRPLDRIEFGQLPRFEQRPPSQWKPAAHDMRPGRQFGPGQRSFVADRLTPLASSR